MRKNPKQAASIFDAYIELTKPRITYLILISTALGYYLGSGGLLKFWEMLICLFGSALVASGSGVLNHFAEVDSDSLMRRTYLRPLPTGLIKPTRAKNFGLILVSVGVIVLYVFINSITAILAILTVILYLFVYTPLKKITWLNTSIGAIPGALPPVGGWTAASGQLEPESWILFGILYFWQHPHFYALALMYQDDYQKAGYHMLPVIEKRKPENKSSNYMAFITFNPCITSASFYWHVRNILFLWSITFRSGILFIRVYIGQKLQS